MQSQTWEEGAVPAQADAEGGFFMQAMRQDSSSSRRGGGPGCIPPTLVNQVVTAGAFYPPRFGRDYFLQESQKCNRRVTGWNVIHALSKGGLRASTDAPSCALDACFTLPFSALPPRQG